MFMSFTKLRNHGEYDKNTPPIAPSPNKYFEGLCWCEYASVGVPTPISPIPDERESRDRVKKSNAVCGFLL